MLAQLVPPATSVAGIFVFLGKMAFLGGILVYMWPKISITLRTTKQRDATQRAKDRYGGVLPHDEEEDISQRLDDRLRT